uniref:Endonuclease-reverse transcriptase n=1 Tax=Macrostomum lignano TaxID=282301 RepID=A0A1I8IZ36_9PLAT
MNSKAKQQPTKIIDTIKSISSKDTASTAVVIAAINEEEQASLFECLQKTDRESLKKEKSDESKRSSNYKERREARFIARLKESLKKLKMSRLTLRRALCLADVQTDVDGTLTQFASLESFIGDLEVLTCRARKKQAEILASIKTQGLSTGAAERLDIDPKFAERLYTFHGFITKYPNLVFSGYSFESLLTYKRAIEKEAEQDDNFCCKLETDITIVFQGEDEDALLEETTMELETASVD